jgi:hypothetical protein
MLTLLLRFNVLDLKPYLRMKSKNEVVAVEAARVVCELHWLYEKDLIFAVTCIFIMFV